MKKKKPIDQNLVKTHDNSKNLDRGKSEGKKGDSMSEIADQDESRSAAVKEEKASAASETDITERVIDDGYFDISDDKKIAIFFVGVQEALESSFGKQKINARKLIKKVPEISNFCDVEVRYFTNKPAASLTPQMMLDLSNELQKKLAHSEFSGAVVVHGADTLEETAFFLGISLSEQFQTTAFKPIVFTTANNPSSKIADNLIPNLVAALRVACHDFRELTPQVLVCINGEIHGSKKIQEVQTSGVCSFKSPGWGPVGYVDRDAVYIRPGSMNEDVALNFPTPSELTAHVGLVKAVTGDKGELVDFMVDKGVAGLIVEGFGRGNLPKSMMNSIRNAIQKGIVVVAATRCEQGRVLDDEEFDGSVADLIQAGALTAGETGSAKTRLLLTYVLSQPEAVKLKEHNPQLFKAFLQECLDPVLADRLFEP